MYKKAIFIFLLCIPLGMQAADVRLYLNRGLFSTVDTTTFPYLAFNATSTFIPVNEVISLAPGDSLHLTVINNDTAIHGFAINGYTSANVIPPGDSIQLSLHFPTAGVFVYYDDYNYPYNTYMGAAGMIHVDNAPGNIFTWNIKEHQSAWNSDIASGLTVNWANYDPDYYTINGKGKPQLEMDTTAVVTGNVGDTIRIYMANTGRSLHSIHFHGYHVRVKTSTNSRILNWEKDTVPIDAMEGITLELIPDKPGRFPVHDHNLIAVTGGGYYPNGMMMMMHIQ